ncbi:MAG: AsmA family protein [Magnetococcales bacterium]|nr:AsmA family protein [Magnetococcales bacterium]
MIFDNTDIALKAWTHGLAFRELGINYKGSVIVEPDFASIQLPNVAMTTQIKADTLPPAGIELGINSDIIFDLARSMATAEKLSVKGPAGMQLSGNIVGKLLEGSPEISGSLVVDKLKIQGLLNALGQPPSQLGSLSHAAMASNFSITNKKVKLNNFSLQLDDTNIKGVAFIDSIHKPVVGFDVVVDDLDLNRYLETQQNVKPSANSSNAPAIVSGTSVSKAAATNLKQTTVKPAMLPLAFLYNKHVYGKAVFGRLKVNKVVMRDLLIETTVNDGFVTLAPVTAKLYDGQLLSNIYFDLNKSEPHVKIATQITGLKAGDLFHDLTGEDKFKGLSNLSFEVASSGSDNVSMLKNLSGTMALDIENGEIHGFDLVEQIRTIYAVVGNQKEDGATGKNLGAKATQFSNLTGQATIKNGVVKNEDLVLTSDLLLLNGEGSVDLVAQEVDYIFNADIYTTIKELNQKEADKIKGLIVPIHIKGKFNNIGPPKIEKDDLSVLLGSALNTKIVKDGLKKLGENEDIKKHINRLEEKFGGEIPVKKLLNGLFGL